MNGALSRAERYLLTAAYKAAEFRAIASSSVRESYVRERLRAVGINHPSAEFLELKLAHITALRFTKETKKWLSQQQVK